MFTLSLLLEQFLKLNFFHIKYQNIFIIASNAMFVFFEKEGIDKCMINLEKFGPKLLAYIIVQFI